MRQAFKAARANSNKHIFPSRLEANLIFLPSTTYYTINEQLFLNTLNIKLECILIILASVTLLYEIQYSIESPTLVFSQELLVADLKNHFICKKSLQAFPFLILLFLLFSLIQEMKMDGKGFLLVLRQ